MLGNNHTGLGMNRDEHLVFDDRLVDLFPFVSRVVSAREPDWPLKSNVARIGYLVPVSVIIHECAEVGDGDL